MKLSQIEKRIPQTFTNSKDIIQKGREHARRSSRARSTCGQENRAWAVFKKIHPGSPGVVNLGACAEFALASCDLLGKTIAFYQVFFQQGRVASGKWCIGPQKGHPRTPGMDLYTAQASFSWPRVRASSLILDQTEAWKVENKFQESPTLSQGLDAWPPPLLSEGLNPPLQLVPLPHYT